MSETTETVPDTLTAAEIIATVEARLRDGTGRAVSDVLARNVPEGKTAQYACEYITEDGRRCAVGCLLTEAEALQIAENNNIAWDNDLLVWMVNDRLEPHEDLLGMLQDLHDTEGHWEHTADGTWILSVQGEQWLAAIKQRFL